MTKCRCYCCNRSLLRSCRCPIGHAAKFRHLSLLLVASYQLLGLQVVTINIVLMWVAFGELIVFWERMKSIITMKSLWFWNQLNRIEFEFATSIYKFWKFVNRVRYQISLHALRVASVSRTTTSPKIRFLAPWADFVKHIHTRAPFMHTRARKISLSKSAILAFRLKTT